MEEWKLNLGFLREDVLSKLAGMLDNSACGWRQLAAAAAEQPTFRCRSDPERTAQALRPVKVFTAKNSF